jgi:hypothetical protein
MATRRLLLAPDPGNELDIGRIMNALARRT